MKFYRLNIIPGVILILFWVCTSCTYDEIPPIKIPQPPVPEETEELEASYLTSGPNTITNSYWLTSDFSMVPMEEVAINQVHEDTSVLNVNGTFNGLTDFSAGDSLMVKLQAAYDDDNIYILVSWEDESYDVSQLSWLFNGPEDPLKSSSSDGWTSQRNDDNLILEFDMGNDEADVWKWSLALSEPLGYAIDMHRVGEVLTYDDGERMFERNVNGTGNAAGPMYEWSGEQQDLEREVNGFTVLDPGYYLLNKTPFVGDVANGAELYQQECAACHGVEGDGDGFDWNTGYAMNLPGFLNRFSREGFSSAVLSSSHDGAGHFEILDDQEREDLIAMVRGFTGVPGYFLQDPTGSSADVRAGSNVAIAQINTRRTNEAGYQVLFIRSLSTGNDDDIQFTNPSGMSISFDVFLTNNDDLNKVGGISETLTFKEP